MLVDHLLRIDNNVGYDVITKHCNLFLTEAGSLPLYKNIQSTQDFCRIKVRQQRKNGILNDAFNYAFAHQYTNIRQRAVLCTSLIEQQSSDQYYIFPVNGFKYLYNKDINDSESCYEDSIATIFEQLSNSTSALDIVSDLLKSSYTSINLQEGQAAGSEIILYNLPAFYAVKCSVHPKYTELYKILTQ